MFLGKGPGKYRVLLSNIVPYDLILPPIIHIVQYNLILRPVK